MEKIDDVNEAASRMLYILIIGIIPLLVILCIYIQNAESPVLKAIAVSTGDLPTLLSTNNTLLSKVMSTYCKTAPFFCLFFFFISHAKPGMNEKNLRH